MADFDMVRKVDGGVHLRLPLRQPFAGDGVLAFLAARAVPGVESVTDDTYAREGTELVVGADAVAVRLSPGDTASLRSVAARARRLFDLDADPSAVDTALAADRLVRPLVERSPGTRLRERGTGSRWSSGPSSASR